MKQLLLVFVVLTMCHFISFSSGTREEEPPKMMMKSIDAEEGAGAMMADDIHGETGGKKQFTSLDKARSVAARGPAVLFFYADWCPTCQAAMKDINASEKRLGNITLFIVDYDKAHDLRDKYLVTYQHTFVQIDENGDKVAIWNGGGVDEILKNIKREGNN